MNMMRGYSMLKLILLKLNKSFLIDLRFLKTQFVC